MDQFRNYIKAISQISDDDLELMMPLLKPLQVKKQERLLVEGDVCKHVYFLKKGFFRMYYVDLEGNEINFRFTDENQFFVDFHSFLTQQPSKFYWQALQDSELWAIKYPDIHQLYKDSPAWEHFGRLMAEHVYKQVSERVEMLLFLSPEDRYQHLLNTRPQLFNQVSQFHISSYLGVKPESLSRLRKRLLRK